MRKNVVPLIALFLASTAIAGVVALEWRAESTHNAQVHLNVTIASLNELQALPFDANPANPMAPGVKARMAALERKILAAAADLDGSAQTTSTTSLVALLKNNFAALDRVYVWSTHRQLPSDPADTLADAAEASFAPALDGLRKRSAGYATASRHSEVEVVAGSIVAIVLLFAGFLFYYLLSAKVRRREGQAYAELDVAQAERKRLLVRTVEAAEDERTRIAVDLHDGPIQRLTAAAFTLDLLGLKLARGERELDGLVVQVRDQLSGEMESLRRLMSDLRPQLLDEGDVSGAIRDCAAELLGAETTCEVHDTVGREFMARGLETVVYLVAREAIVNVRKHAHASHVDVTLAPDGDSLRLTIVDDGSGFEPATAAAERLQHHLGLIAMQERVESVGGELRIVSSPGAGTRIDAILPRPQASELSRVGRRSNGAVA
jgi:signal transduction histidine kinase